MLPRADREDQWGILYRITIHMIVNHHKCPRAALRRRRVLIGGSLLGKSLLGPAHALTRRPPGRRTRSAARFASSPGLDCTLVHQARWRSELPSRHWICAGRRAPGSMSSANLLTRLRHCAALVRTASGVDDTERKRRTPRCSPIRVRPRFAWRQWASRRRCGSVSAAASRSPPTPIAESRAPSPAAARAT